MCVRLWWECVGKMAGWLDRLTWRKGGGVGPYRVDKARLFFLPLKKERVSMSCPRDIRSDVIALNLSKKRKNQSRFLGQFLRPARICSSFMPTTRRRPSFYFLRHYGRISNPITLETTSSSSYIICRNIYICLGSLRLNLKVLTLKEFLI